MAADALRFSVLYAAIFIALTGVDLLTTYRGLEMGFREINPYTDTSSLRAMAQQEILPLLLGCISVFIGALRAPEKFSSSAETDFKTYKAQLFKKPHLVPALLVFVPMLLACGRLIPILNNTFVLLWGRGFIGEIVPPVVFYIIAFLFFYKPITYMVHRMALKFKTTNSPG